MDNTAADGRSEDARLCSPASAVTLWVYVPFMSHAVTIQLLMDVLKMLASAALALLLLGGFTFHLRPMQGRYGC